MVKPRPIFFVFLLSNSTPTHKQVRTAQKILGAPYEGAGARATRTALRVTSTPECFWVLEFTGGKATGAAPDRQQAALLGAKTRATERCSRSASILNSPSLQQPIATTGAQVRRSAGARASTASSTPRGQVHYVGEIADHPNLSWQKTPRVRQHA